MSERYQKRENAPTQAPQGTPSIDGKTSYDPVEVGKALVDRMVEAVNTGSRKKFTTSQLRKVLSTAVVVNNRLLREAGQSDKIPAELIDEIQYMRLKLVYQMGREEGLKFWLTNQGIDMAAVIQNIHSDKSAFFRFYRLLESIIAYHKYHEATLK